MFNIRTIRARKPLPLKQSGAKEEREKRLRLVELKTHSDFSLSRLAQNDTCLEIVSAFLGELVGQPKTRCKDQIIWPNYGPEDIVQHFEAPKSS